MSTKRILSLVLALVMVLGTFGTMVFAETGNDKVDWLIDQGIVQGDETGDLKLNATIDRASVAKLVVEALDLGSVAEGMKGYKTSFSDVPVTHWANGFINVVSARGIMIGDAGKFMPGNQISYAEVLTILVRIMDGLTADEEKAAVWPTTYIAKAHELGILEDVTVVSYQEAAVRERIFEMFYNAMTNMEVGNYTIVKAIVLENNRVERLSENEVVVEVIREIQRADFAEESRLEKGDQPNFIIDPKVGDVEYLLGRVADFTLNKKGEVVKVTVDDSYKVEIGAFKATRNKMGSYTVELPERFDERDERIFRTYYNNKAYGYVDFYSQDKDNRSEFNVEYARITVKNGKVLFIDAFNFDDVAPVKEVKNDGAEVYVYNDARDGSVKRYNLGATATVLLVEDNVISVGSREDIKVNDVIHEFDGGYIVKKDAAVNGVFEKVSLARNGNVYVHVDGEEYLVLDKENRRPVYSFETNDDFFVLNAQFAHSELEEFRDEDVTILTDLAGNLQFIGSQIELGEFVGLVTRVVGRDIRVLRTDGKTYDYHATLNTRVNNTGHQTLNNILAGDLVFISANGEEIERIVNLRQNETEKAVEGLTTRQIKLSGESEYRILGETNVFVAQGGVYQVRTAKEVADSFAKNSDDVRAYVLDGDEFADETRRPNLAPRGTEAHTIVFTKIALAQSSKTEIVEYNGYADRQETQMRVILEDGTREVRTVKKALPAFNGGDIIEITISANDDKDILGATRLIANTKSDVWGVSAYDGRNLLLVGATGTPRELFVTNSTVIFGNLSGARRVKVVAETPDTRYAKAILVMDNNDVVTANPGPATLTGVITHKNATPGSTDEGRIMIDNSELYVVNANTILYDANKVPAAVGYTAIEALLTEDVTQVVDVNVVNGVVVSLRLKADFALLNNEIATAEALQEADYLAGWAGLQSALAAATRVANNNVATQGEVDAALGALQTARNGLTAKNPSTIVFANAVESKVYGDPKFVNTVDATSVGNGAITYSSGTPSTATVNSVTGEVTIVGVGTTIITAKKAATATHKAVTATYTLTVTPKGLTVTGLTAVYNPAATAGEGTVTITGTPVLEGVVAGDAVTLTGTATGELTTPNQSDTNAAVTVSGLSLTGAKANNYTLSLPTDLTVDSTATQ